jgi:hypothetical protein
MYPIDPTLENLKQIAEDAETLSELVVNNSSEDEEPNVTLLVLTRNSD